MDGVWGDIIASAITGICTIGAVHFGANTIKKEVLKDKQAFAREILQDVPFEIMELVPIVYKNKKSGTDEEWQEKLRKILSKTVAYGSKDASKIAQFIAKMVFGEVETRPKKEIQYMEKEQHYVLLALGLLTTQLKYDLTDEIVSLEYWLRLCIDEYHFINYSANTGSYDELSGKLKEDIDALVDKLKLNKKFKIKENTGG